MKKIIATVGISNSGKSTWAHEQWAKDPENTVLVNRDKIRELLFGFTEENVKEYYSRKDLSKLEKLVTKYENTLTYEGLRDNKTVIVDETHLQLKYLRELNYWNVPVELKWFDITLEEAIRRDGARVRQAGADIIEKQYNRYIQLKGEEIPRFEYVYLENDSSKPPCFIFDIDGTLAHMKDRSPYDWKRVGEDLVDHSTASILEEFMRTEANHVVICTGRDGSCLEETKEWLKQHQLHYHDIFIRSQKDMRPDWVIKEEMWREISKDYYIAGMFDDRLQVVRRARALGLKVFNVEHNNF